MSITWDVPFLPKLHLPYAATAKLTRARHRDLALQKNQNHIRRIEKRPDARGQQLRDYQSHCLLHSRVGRLETSMSISRTQTLSDRASMISYQLRLATCRLHEA